MGQKDVQQPDFILANKVKFYREETLEMLRKQDEWGNEMCLKAATEVLHSNIHVVRLQQQKKVKSRKKTERTEYAVLLKANSPGNDVNATTFMPDNTYDPSQLGNIYLGYTGTHYVACFPRNKV